MKNNHAKSCPTTLKSMVQKKNCAHEIFPHEYTTYRKMSNFDKKK